MNWMRANEQSSDLASARASIVLPVPGQVLQQQVAARDQAGQAEPDDVVLAEDGRLDVVHDALERVGVPPARRRTSVARSLSSANVGPASGATSLAATGGEEEEEPGQQRDGATDEADQRQGAS